MRSAPLGTPRTASRIRGSGCPRRAGARGSLAQAPLPAGSQSINQSNPQSATRAQEKPHPSATTRAANPATRSVAGLGGSERVAQALACVTRSMFTRFLQKRAKNCCIFDRIPRWISIVRASMPLRYFCPMLAFLLSSEFGLRG